MRKKTLSKNEIFPKAARKRVIIEAVRPNVDGGRYPIKRTVGEKIVVTADIFTDGHDAISAYLSYKHASEKRWHAAKMAPLGNDVWRGTFTVDQPPRFQYTIAAWIDRFASWRNELEKRVDAGQDVAGELLEGASLVMAAARRAKASDAQFLRERATRITGDRSHAKRISAALDANLSAAMSAVPDDALSTVFDRILEVTVDRERARFGAWYEMFPRSAGPDPTRSATFREAEARLPAIAAMGFDVLYLPPIHPIGRSYRKGPNNVLSTGADDPGCPWAIGSERGGHKAVEPGLGTLSDFKHFLEAARSSGLEVALDIAYQCSPDHPYVKKHPEWFRRNSDGSIKYAENPPKKYQDIYPMNFNCADWKGLWTELKSIVLFWIEQGVRIFRVDNPHTKPLQFWEWLIRGVQNDYPDVIFLSEAFTRPKVMYRLAKLGFTQSYTYFTWRNNKSELTDYMTELTQTPVREYFRPNFFANTPDILHEYLQIGGRPAFQVRLVLAATLAASYGIYSGFELCENRAAPGTEEYRNSEKYQIRAWDWDRPGNIIDLVAKVNKIRHQNRALHDNDRLRFYAINNDQIIFYAKTTEDLSNIIMVAVNLDTERPQTGWVQIPLDEIGIGKDETFQVHDLISNARYLWRGEFNYIGLDPAVCPAHIFKVRRKRSTKRDFDHFR